METIAPEESKTVGKESFLSSEEVAALLVPDDKPQKPEVKVTQEVKVTPPDEVAKLKEKAFSIDDIRNSFDASRFNKAVLGNLEASGVIPELEKTRADFRSVTQGYTSWKMVVGDPQAVALVKKDTELQQAAVAAPTKNRIDRSQYEVAPDRFNIKDESTKAKASPGVTFKGIDAKNLEYDYKAAQDLINPGPNSAQVILAPKRQEVAPGVTRTSHAPLRPGALPRNAPSPDGAASMPSAQERVIPTVSGTPSKTRSLESSIDSNRQHGMDTEVVEVMEGLQDRKAKGIKGLLEKGVSVLPKSLEQFNKMSSRKKLALGIIFAGASIATGGAFSVVSRGISTAGFASQRYERVLKERESKNTETNKALLAATSVLYGFALSLGTSQIMSEVFSHIEVPDSVKEKVADFKDSLKNFFASFSGATPAQVLPPPPSGPADINGLVLQNSVAPTMTTPDHHGVYTSGSEAASALEAAKVNLPEYLIHSGDNLTKIIRDQVLPSIPGVESMTDFQKNNIIENLLQQAKDNPTSPYYATLNQFADPSRIVPGKMLDLNEIRQGIVGYHNNAFGGTLLDHAKTITQSVQPSAPSVFTSGTTVVESTNVTSGGADGMYYPGTQDEGYNPTVAQAPDATYYPGTQGEGYNPPLTRDPGALYYPETQGEGHEAVPATSLQHPISVPKAPAGTLVDQFGEPITDGSGNSIRTGGVSDNRA